MPAMSDNNRHLENDLCNMRPLGTVDEPREQFLSCQEFSDAEPGFTNGRWLLCLAVEIFRRKNLVVPGGLQRRRSSEPEMISGKATWIRQKMNPSRTYTPSDAARVADSGEREPISAADGPWLLMPFDQVSFVPARSATWSVFDGNLYELMDANVSELAEFKYKQAQGVAREGGKRPPSRMVGPKRNLRLPNPIPRKEEINIPAREENVGRVLILKNYKHKESCDPRSLRYIDIAFGVHPLSHPPGV
ncbi:hypothetical protein BU15DRAFT_66916 [Melanogaster broomeanus]|nr:hypothetical protein BU15DRAFT_66916 [Melanogaster broomeanus]